MNQLASASVNDRLDCHLTETGRGKALLRLSWRVPWRVHYAVTAQTHMPARVLRRLRIAFG